MKKYKVQWTHEASIDLIEIIEYISLDRPSVANSIFYRIKKHCLNLQTNPLRYRIVPELSILGFVQYREIISDPYRIIYKVTESDIYVFAVVDCRRDFEEFIYNRLIRTE